MGIFHSSTNIHVFDLYVCRYLRANTRAELNQIIQDVKNDPDIYDADKYGIITICERKVII